MHLLLLCESIHAMNIVASPFNQHTRFSIRFDKCQANALQRLSLLFIWNLSFVASYLTIFNVCANFYSSILNINSNRYNRNCLSILINGNALRGFHDQRKCCVEFNPASGIPIKSWVTPCFDCSKSNVILNLKTQL